MWSKETLGRGWMKMPHVVLCHAGPVLGISTTELWLLVNIASTTGLGPVVYREADLAERANRTQRTVQRALINLEERGLIDIENGTGRGHLYAAPGFIAVMNDIGENIAAGRRPDDALGIDILKQRGFARRRKRIEGKDTPPIKLCVAQT